MRAGETTKIVYGKNTGSQSCQYNSRLQLTRLTALGIDLQYSYAAAPNNSGKLAQMTDAVSGETVTYAYDALNRLLTANSSLGAGYNQSYMYDGFGNLSSKNGGQTGWGVDQATNRAIGPAYDTNGNAGSMPGMFTYAVYDVENRMAAVNPWAGGIETYAYGMDNKRVWKLRTDGLEEIYLYGAMGEKLGTYAVSGWAFSGGGFVLSFAQVNTNLYFAGKMIQSQGSFVSVDRLGSVRQWVRGFEVLCVWGGVHGDAAGSGEVWDVLSGWEYGVGLCGPEVLCEYDGEVFDAGSVSGEWRAE